MEIGKTLLDADADLRAMTWKLVPNLITPERRIEVTSYNGEIDPGPNKRTVLALRVVSGGSVRYEAAHVNMRTGTITRLPPDMAETAFALASK